MQDIGYTIYSSRRYKGNLWSDIADLLTYIETTCVRSHMARGTRQIILPRSEPNISTYGIALNAENQQYGWRLVLPFKENDCNPSCFSVEMFRKYTERPGENEIK